MLVIPAIDIKNGKCVRLIQGEEHRETVYSNDPVSMAQKFESLGAKLIHVVDLDGAFQGYPVNKELVKSIAKSISIPIEIGGGIRNIDAIKEYIDAGIKRIIIGTAILDDVFKDIIKVFKKNIIIGIDVKNSNIATHGWKNVSNINSINFIKELTNEGISEIIYTDIKTDGMLSGPNIEAIKNILSEIKDIQLVASGGVSSIDDINDLEAINDNRLKGCIVGKAIYDGRIDLKEIFKGSNV